MLRADGRSRVTSLFHSAIAGAPCWEQLGYGGNKSGAESPAFNL